VRRPRLHATWRTPSGKGTSAGQAMGRSAETAAGRGPRVASPRSAMPARSTLGYWLGRFAVGLALLAAAGFGVVRQLLGHVDQIGIGTLLAGIFGFHLALGAVTPLVRLLTRNAHRRSPWQSAANEAFARASLPRRIYHLLVSVAEADGPMTAAERETVRHFVLERFADPVHAEEVRAWETQPFPLADRAGLAARIGASLDDTELDSLFCWCCLVAFADGRFAEVEHHALREVARGLGIAAPRARMLFHLARAQFLGGDRRGRSGGPHPQRPRAADARAQALATLGLPVDASAEQIRKRHRELVRRFHPDAQPNLGPVAQREATERFTAIQRAYETLSANAPSA
jgi:DnaJ-domain-containing protein 1